MGDSGGGGGPWHVGNEDNCASTNCAEPESRGHRVPPLSPQHNAANHPPPARSPTSCSPSVSHSFGHGSLAQSFTSPGIKPARPGGMEFASVGSGLSRLEGPESPSHTHADRKICDGQGRNILQVPTYRREKKDQSCDWSASEGSSDRGNLSMRVSGHSDTDNRSTVTKKQDHSLVEEGTGKYPSYSTKQEDPGSPHVYPSQPIFPQNEVRRIYLADTSSDQAAEGSPSQPIYLNSGVAAGMNPEMFNVPFSSKAFTSHLSEFSKIHGNFMNHQPAHLSSYDALNHNVGSAQDQNVKNSPPPGDCQSEGGVTTDNVDHGKMSGCELKKQQEEKLSSQAEMCPSQQPPSPSHPPRGSADLTSQSQSFNTPAFVVTPGVYSDSDTDEYTEADYKPVIEKLVVKTVQNNLDQKTEKKSMQTKRTRAARKGAKLKVVVKEEAVSDQSSGSDYHPSTCGKVYPTRKKISERVLPVRQKRQSVPSSFLEYYEDSDDSVSDKSPPARKVTRSAKKPASDPKDDQSESKTKKPMAARRGKARQKSSSKGPSSRTCPECHKTFSRADSLTVHMRVHTGDRPFRCQECDATYKVSSHLRNHVRSKHSNVKAYKCDNCGKAFSTSNAKRRHEKTCGTDLSERVKHQCSRCQKRFVTEEGYERHKSQDTCSVREMSIDPGDDDQNIDNAGEITTKYEGKAYKCTVCPKVFAELSSLNTHQRFLCGKAPGAGPYTCSQCKKEFPRWNRFVAHCRRHTGDKPYTCPHCDSRFFDKDSLRKHVSRHKGKNIVKCSLCEKQFTVKRTLAMHIMRVHCGMKPYKCNECDGDFASAKLLSTHIRRVHRKEKRFKCQICGRAFFESQAWMKHMILHAGDRPPRIRGPVHKYPCNLCGKSFNMRLMRMHVEEDHPGVALSEAVTKAMVTCKLCKKEFSDPSSLKMHMIRHSGKKDFKCDKCEMYFITPAAMQLHQRKHSDDRPYACEECGQTFRWRASLRDHKMHLHNPNLDPPDANGRRFGCKECGQRFKRYNTLRTHMIRHRGVMPCICSECGKGFTDNTRLRIHMSCHNGSDRPFICETCGAGFYYSFLLKRHIQSRHNPSPWLCNLCGRSLCSKDALKRHIAHHANSPDGKVRVGGNRGRPRKHREPDDSEEASKLSEQLEPKMKGKRGRKSKKTIEVLKQIEDEVVYQKVLQDEVRNMIEPSNSSESRDMMESKKSMDSSEMAEHRNTVEPRNMMIEPENTVENRNSVEARNMMDPRFTVEQRNVMEPRNMIDPRNIMDARNTVDPMSMMDPRNTLEPRSNMMGSRNNMEPRNMMEHRNSVEPRNMIENRNVVDPRNMMEGRSIMEPMNMMESRNMMEPRNMVEPRNLMEPRNMVEARNMMEPRNKLESRSMMESRGTVEPRNMMDSRSTIEPRNMMDSRSTIEPRNMMDSRSTIEPRNMMESRNTVEPRIIESRNTAEPRNMMDSRNTMEPRIMDSRNIMEPKTMMDSRSTIEPRNMMDSRNTGESRNMEPRSTLEPENTVEHRSTVESRNSVEPRIPVDPRNTLQALPESSKEPSEGGTYVELTRASEMQINSHLYAQQNFGYSPANYMMNPTLWPKTEER